MKIEEPLRDSIKFSDEAESDTDTDSNLDEERSLSSSKKRKVEEYSEFVLPPGFLAPLNVAPLSQAPLPPSGPSFVTPPSEAPVRRSGPPPPPPSSSVVANVGVKGCNQFWKAGDYEVPKSSSSSLSSGLVHARVHPKFLHTNATSHTWALGAFAELLDNSVDEIRNGATYVTIDVLENKKDKNKMLLVQDNGGGMSIDTIRHCMSLGYSVKSKIANTIGQYGNGFKTSTMRLGADVIVFTRCRGKDGGKPTQSIGMLSYTFLRRTGKDDIVVPTLDYEKEGLNSWKQIVNSSIQDWNTNLESILQWSPYSSEADLVKEFELMGEQGTRVIIYNLWDLEPGKLELDFETDPEDIQLASVKRDQEKVEEAKKYPSSRHFLTYEHSMRSYASILYLKLPSNFRIILRGKPVEHHNLVDDMMLKMEVKYRPSFCPKAPTPITLGFVKDAVHHISIQGFCVYHNNRLIKPFWKVWFVAGSGGRGITGVLEANFVEPAHNKQDFEDTPVLKRLQNVLKDHQKAFWNKYKEKVGYVAAPSNKRLHADVEDHDSSPKHMSTLPPHYVSPMPQTQPGKFTVTCDASKTPRQEREQRTEEVYSANLQIQRETSKMVEYQSSKHACGPIVKATAEADLKENQSNMHASSHASLLVENDKLKHVLTKFTTHLRHLQSEKSRMEGNLKEKSQHIEVLMKEANAKLMEKDGQIERIMREANAKLKEKDQQIEKLMKEANARIEIVNQERNRRDKEEAALRMSLTEAKDVIGDLQKKLIKQEPYY